VQYLAGAVLHMVATVEWCGRFFYACHSQFMKVVKITTKLMGSYDFATLWCAGVWPESGFGGCGQDHCRKIVGTAESCN